MDRVPINPDAKLLDVVVQFVERYLAHQWMGAQFEVTAEAPDGALLCVHFDVSIRAVASMDEVLPGQVFDPPLRREFGQ